MRLKERRSDAVTVIEVQGRLRLDDGVQEFREAVVRLLMANESRIVIDLAGCQHVDSAGLGELATAMVRAQRAGGQLVLLKPSERLRELLRVSRLLDVFTVSDDETAALTAAAAGGR